MGINDSRYGREVEEIYIGQIILPLAILKKIPSTDLDLKASDRPIREIDAQDIKPTRTPRKLLHPHRIMWVRDSIIAAKTSNKFRSRSDLISHSLSPIPAYGDAEAHDARATVLSIGADLAVDCVIHAFEVNGPDSEPIQGAATPVIASAIATKEGSDGSRRFVLPR